jgi:hypothetical protein
MGRLKAYPYSISRSITDFLDRFIVRRARHTDKDHINYGIGDRLPQEIIELIASNGVALRAMKLRAKYIYGYGFADEVVASMPVANGMNANQLLSKIKTDVAMFQGFAVQVLRKADGTIGEVKHVPFELIRRKENGDFAINVSLGTNKENKENWEDYPRYKGKQLDPEQLQAQLKEFGKKAEIAYYWDKDAISYDYPIPDWFASEFDVRTGTELMLLDNEMVTNGFMPSAIMTFVGGIDDEQEDDEGNTAADIRDRSLRQFTGNSRNPETGKSSRMRLLTFDVDSADQVPKLETFDIEKIITGSVEKRDDINRQICRLFGFHPVLLGYTDPTVLGNQLAIANASEQAAQDVYGDQEMVREAFGDLFDGDFTISKFVPINYISDKILDDLSPDERRDIAGYEPIEVNEDVNKSILDTLNSLSPLLAASVVKAMKTEALLELVGIDPSKAKPDDSVTDDTTDVTI